MPPRSLLFLSLNSLLFIISLGQNGALGATCTLSSFKWATNSLGQDPCSLAVQLEFVCGIQSVLPDLPPGGRYNPPNSKNACTCSSVVYSLVSACAECQGASSVSWSKWTEDCSESSLGFPETLPAGVAVPSWAYLDVATSNKFSVAQARRVAITGPTESTGPMITFLDTNTVLPTAVVTSPSRPVSTSNTTSTVVPSNPLSLPATQTPSSTSKSNVGPIIGGAVGGFVFVVLSVGLLFWWIVRRRRSRIAPSTAYINAYGPLTDGPAHALYSRVRSPPISYSPSPESQTTLESSKEKEGRFSPTGIAV